jgi:hypothetical protein
MTGLTETQFLSEETQESPVCSRDGTLELGRPCGRPPRCNTTDVDGIFPVLSPSQVGEERTKVEGNWQAERSRAGLEELPALL